jgi:hypothetical protein
MKQEAPVLKHKYNSSPSANFVHPVLSNNIILIQPIIIIIIGIYDHRVR